MSSLQNHLPLLSLLASCSPQQRVALLKTSSSQQIKSICEVCKNVLAGNVPVNINKTKKYKSHIRLLASKSVPIIRKRNTLLKQKGGFLPLILPAAVSMFGSLIGKAIGKRL